MWIGAGGYVDRCMGLMSVEQDGMGSSVERSGAEEYTACQTAGAPSIQCAHSHLDMHTLTGLAASKWFKFFWKITETL